MRTISIFITLMFMLAFAGGCNSTEADAKTKKATVDPNKNPVVVMETSMGTIEIELFKKEAPLSTANFLKYTDEKFYDGTIFHRIIPTFMIQGGGFTADMKKKQNHPPIKNEATNGLKNSRGTLSMARTSVVDSATSQFFINVVDNKSLDHTNTSSRGYGYAVFGKVIKGMEVVDKIKAVETGMCGHMRDCPKTPVVIKSVRRK